MKIAVVYSDYYKEICDGLLKSCHEAAKDVDVVLEEFRASGAFEIPLGVKRVINDFDGVVTLGCVVQGETHHHDMINYSVAQALMDLSLEYMKPVGFGILTTKNYDQAKARLDKGKETFNAVHEMLSE